jgi:oxygen-independent coproporphyrinogen-3 oxidase
MFESSPLSIYLHIPFCSVRCSYCAFNTYTDLDHLVPSYIDALCREIELLSVHNPHPSVHTIFFGGGTPSLIPAASYQRIFETLRACFDVADDAEISIESNPNDLSVAYLQALREVGFNRLSIGMQSATEKILTLFEREHDAQMVSNAMDNARVAGFDNVNLDVIFASPYETMHDWQQTVDMVQRLNPEHLSMYGLELKGGTDLRLRVDAGDLPQPDDDLFADMYDYASDVLAAAGYTQYEISNWCKPNRQCQHNLQYWRNLPYAGLGAGAHGFAGGYRYSTISSPQRYVKVLTEANTTSSVFPLTPAIGKSTQVQREDDLYETIMMGLRLTAEGLDRRVFMGRFGRDFVDMFPEGVERFMANGLLEVTDERVHLTDAGRLLSNMVIREFV